MHAYFHEKQTNNNKNKTKQNKNKQQNNDLIVQHLSSLSALQVVVMTTCGATNGERIFITSGRVSFSKLDNL